VDDDDDDDDVVTEYALKSVAVQQFQNYVEAWQCPGWTERVPQSPYCPLS